MNNGEAAHKASTPALQVDSLEAGYDSTKVLRGVSLSVASGGVTALIGPNGAGKSTLLRTIAGTIRPMSGEVRLEGKVVTGIPAYQRSSLGLCHIAEGRAVFKRLTVRENLIMQAERGHEKEAVERSVAIFPILGSRMKQSVGTMSGGEQQMLAMARAYVREPRVVLVDEPSLGLAPRFVDVIFNFLSNDLVLNRKVAVLVVDQYVGRVLDMAQNAYVMTRGQIAFSGSAKDLLSSDLSSHYLSADSTS